MITFETEETPKKAPKFGDVEENQPFVDSLGQLCMKSSNSTYVILARSDGTPWVAFSDQINEDTEITRIRTAITKINF